MIRPATVTKKKKAKNGKAKEHKGKNGNVGKIEKGFENPVYEVEDDQNFYQPETIGEEDDGSPSASKDEEEL
ncbi:hypothetical protein EB796_023360 [Bugula neritina]|uniref:Uncharacterized protein n=1 Tax=Bugula neritina TaxID=10212 RepID=A0A7J7IWP6_BUGNE|nr:hypothetical protein EB796_023360 [Bugula neritina]